GAGPRGAGPRGAGHWAPSGGKRGAAGALSALFGGAKAAGARPAPPFSVVYRQPLAKGASVSLVEAGAKSLLLGVTEHTVTLLAELNPEAPDELFPDELSPGELPLGEPAFGALAHRRARLPTEAPPEAPALARATRNGARPRATGAGSTDYWLQAGRTPASPENIARAGRSDNAWKLALDSLRERTVRR
ncbi:MAG: flagellar biosynthetic protein FliO, partial [Acidimicrobiales bacterium]